jgi:hypothetical protein
MVINVLRILAIQSLYCIYSVCNVHDVLPEGRRQECRPGWVSVRRTQTFYSQTAAPEHIKKLYLKVKSHNVIINLIQYYLTCVAAAFQSFKYKRFKLILGIYTIIKHRLTEQTA